MEVLLDVAKCQGFASCVISAPEVFDLDEVHSKAVILDPHPSPDLRAVVYEAASTCPVQAITVND